MGYQVPLQGNPHGDWRWRPDSGIRPILFILRGMQDEEDKKALSIAMAARGSSFRYGKCLRLFLRHNFWAHPGVRCLPIE
jgi:hypothetical protein